MRWHWRRMQESFMASEPKLTDAHRLAFLAGVSLQVAGQALAGGDRRAIGGSGGRADAQQAALAKFVENGRLKAFSKPDPNEVTQQQAEQLPGIATSRVHRVTQGR